MERSEFLTKITSLSREEIEKIISEKEKVHKKICPAVKIIRRDKDKQQQK